MNRTNPQASSIPNGLAVVSDGACWCVLHPEQRLRSRDSVSPRAVVLSSYFRGQNEAQMKISNHTRISLNIGHETTVIAYDNGDIWVDQKQFGRIATLFFTKKDLLRLIDLMDEYTFIFERKH